MGLLLAKQFSYMEDTMDEHAILTHPRTRYSNHAHLLRRRNALWQKIEKADAEGDDYHVTLWMRLLERLETQIEKEENRE